MEWPFKLYRPVGLQLCEEIRADFDIAHEDFLSISKFVTLWVLFWGQADPHKTVWTGQHWSFGQIFQRNDGMARVASLLYSNSSGYDSLKLLWERDLEVTFNHVDWDKICRGVFPKCASVSIHEQNFFHQTNYTPVRLQSMFNDTSNLCCKCTIHKSTFILLF